MVFGNFEDGCVKQLSSLQEEFKKLYDINSYEHWYYDHDMGVFHFKSDDGRNLYFKYVDVGSFFCEAKYMERLNTIVHSIVSVTSRTRVPSGFADPSFPGLFHVAAG
jgi:hypothetical protein